MATKTSSDLGTYYYSKKDFSKALTYLQQASDAEPLNTKILLKMANCYLRLKNYDEAIIVIEQVLTIDTDNDKLYYHLCLLHYQLGHIENTIEACKRALEINSLELDYYVRLANLYEQTNEHVQALEIICRAISQFPDSVPLQISAARSERRLGKHKDCFKRLKDLSARESRLSPEWKVQYYFELGFSHDVNGSTDLAFQHFTRANNIIRTLPSYQRVDINHSFNIIRNQEKLDFGKIEKIIDVSRKNPPSVQPVFFVGFPRSGTTLLQKVLDSHPDIKVIEENNPLGCVTEIIEKEPEKYLQSSFLLDEKNIGELRDKYFNEARCYVPVDSGLLLIDKLPMNIVQIPVIKILFPDARVILGLRHPCDSILSCFMQNFAVNRAMAKMFEFNSIINYYDKTMRLWNVFSNEIDFESFNIRYEDLIENMEGEVRKLLNFLNLPWDDGVLNYRQNAFERGFINTPSYSQVVKPIYKDARYRWQRYAKYFEPYLEKLEPHCKNFGYSLEANGPVKAYK